MANFPSLSTNPEYGIKEGREDSTISSKMDGGYQVTRQRFSRVRKKWSIKYPHLTESDITTLRTFVDVTTKGGADYFSWTNPIDSVTYTVRFEKPPEFTLISGLGGNRYSTEFVLIEV